MSILSSLFGGLAGATIGKLFGGGKKSKEPTLQDQLAPFLQQFSNISNTYSSQAGADYSKAGAGYDEALNYFRSIMSGNREDLLKVTDASAITKASDEQAQQNYELAPRGGRRAATAQNSSFDTFAELNRYLQNLRGQAPGQIANIAQAIGNMAQGKLSAAMGGTSGGSNLLFGEEQIKQQIADRHAALLGSIFEAAGAVAGAFACNTLDTWIFTPSGYKQLKDIQEGDRVSIPVGMNGEFAEGIVIRKKIEKEQDIFKLTSSFNSIKGTSSHVFSLEKEIEIRLGDISPSCGIEVPFFINNVMDSAIVHTIELLPNKEDVAILKLNDEENNYNYITNGYISVDADCLR